MIAGSIHLPVVDASGPVDSVAPLMSKNVCIWKMRFGARLRAADI